MSSSGSSETIEAIAALAHGVAAGMGLEVVDVTYRGAGNRWLLRVDVDKPGPKGVGIDDCERMSKALASALEEASLIEHGYVLEVSSPGIDRPLRTPDDFRRNAGRRLVLEATGADGNRRSFRGLLLGTEGEELRVREDDGTEVRIPLAGVTRARQDAEF